MHPSKKPAIKVSPRTATDMHGMPRPSQLCLWSMLFEDDTVQRTMVPLSSQLARTLLLAREVLGGLLAKAAMAA